MFVDFTSIVTERKAAHSLLSCISLQNNNFMAIVQLRLAISVFDCLEELVYMANVFK